jgi:F5/8 type C domain
MPTYPRKRHRADEIEPQRSDPGQRWLDVRTLARVQASSEDPQHPVAHAFSGREGRGWRAADTGPQVIDLHFRQARDVTRIRLVFEDERQARTQEFTISWSAQRGERHGEVIRQQFNFSPEGAIREVEDYVVALRGIDRLTIRITPDISGRSVRASLTECRLA